MPLFHSKSKKHNDESEMGQPQSMAIAYNVKKHGKKMAMGGRVEGNYQSSCSSSCNSPCEIHEQASGYQDHKGNDVKHNEAASMESGRKLNQHGADEEGPQGARMAHGGYAEHQPHPGPSKSEHQKEYEAKQQTKHEAHLKTPEGDEERRKRNAEMKAKYLAEGGFIDGNYQDESPDMENDLVSRVMRQRMYSKGGMVANDTPNTAGFEENDFDYLAKNDDLESSYDGANSGDELGNEGEDERRRDIVMRAMLARRKQRNPVPA